MSEASSSHHNLAACRYMLLHCGKMHPMAVAAIMEGAQSAVREIQNSHSIGASKGIA